MRKKLPKKVKTHPSKLVEPIIPLDRPGNYQLDVLEYIDYMYHNTSGDATSGKHAIKITRFVFGTSTEEWIIFVDLVQKSLGG